MMSKIPIEDALEILSNQYRRDILRLITIKERYAFELSKLLEISQRAVSNHLKSLQEAGLVISEKRKSTKGPEREYFHLSSAVILSLTVAPNLFLATIRPLDEEKLTAPLEPEYQLGAGEVTKDLKTTLSEGLELLPQIREGLDLLEARQSKLLRAYQGLRNHVKECMEDNRFSTKAIRLILLLMEKDGEVTKEEVELSMGESFENLTDMVNNLKEQNLISSEFYENKAGEMSFKLKLKFQ